MRMRLSSSGEAPTMSWVDCPAGANGAGAPGLRPPREVRAAAQVAGARGAEEALPLHGVPDLAHGGEHRARALLGAEGLQRPRAGELDVHGDAVRQPSQGVEKLGGGAGDGLGVDVAVEAVLLSEEPEDLDHALARAVGPAEHPGAQEEPLDVVAAVEVHGELRELRRLERGRGVGVGAAVDAVGAVVGAGVGHEHLEQGHAAAVRREAVAAPRGARGAEGPLPRPAVHARRRAGRVVLGGVRQYGELREGVHAASW